MNLLKKVNTIRNKLFYCNLILYRKLIKFFDNRLLQYSFNTLIVFSILINIYSPVISLGFVLILLTINFKGYSRLISNISGISLVLSFSLIHASRAVLIAPNDDMNYYYHSIYKGGLENFFTLFSNSSKEPIFYFYVYFIKFLFPNLSPSGLVFVFSLIGGLLFLLWLNLFFYKRMKITEFSFLICLSIFSLSIFYYGQLSRQMLSINIFLFSLLVLRNRPIRMYTLWILAFFTHSTILIYIFLLKLTNLSLKKYLIIMTSILIISYLIFILLIWANDKGFLDFLPIIKYKMDFYRNWKFNIVDHDLISLKPFLITLTYILLLSRQFYKHAYFKFFIGILLIYIFYLPIPLLGFRLGLIVTSVLLGCYTFYAFRNFLLPYRILFILIILKSSNYYFTYKQIEPFNGFELFYQYPAFSTNALYYFQKF